MEKDAFYGFFEKFGSRLSSCNWANMDIQQRISHKSWRRLARLNICTYFAYSVSSITYLKLKNINLKTAAGTAEKWRNLLFSFQGVALAFWMFDIATTFYAINVTV